MNPPVLSSESEDEDLVLEGTLVRNNDVSDSSSSGEESHQDQRLESGKKRKRSHKNEAIDILEVEFTFCDMNEKFFHGIKSLLTHSSTIYRQPSILADAIIGNVAVGTVVSTEGDSEGYVFGFASVLNVVPNEMSSPVNDLVQECLTGCPTPYKAQMNAALSGKTGRRTGFLIHGRMINMPLEIVEVLHQQLVLDLDWAAKHAPNANDQLDVGFETLVLLAPCTKENNVTVYRFFDDEIFAKRGDFFFTIEAPKSYSREEKQLVNVVVMSKTQHRLAVQDLTKLMKGKA